MHQAAELVLTDVLQKYGSTACDTPQLLETFLRKYGRGCLHEVDVLISALRGGVVTDLRADPSSDKAALSRVLAIQARLPQPQADWAVKAWSVALAKAPAQVSGIWPAESAQRSASYSPARAAGLLAMAAATGVFAYLTFGR
jgi:hypothetical protein